ncbi:Bone marrow stromal antigen 2 [Fukomys damarensis]|uniref:Bone marrow stromal antigen 2 n=1 Tax=Fukomys damarensis TaxID=885580 RepID=A0A091D168_FUKDA|nr:Bone marrow stromal antigen 2 [Fukomys damarensis]
MDDVWRGKNGRDCRLLQPAVLGVLLAVIVVLAVTLGYSGTKTCDACEDGLRAEARCHNITDHLQDRLTRAQKTLQDARALCDSTVENLNAALAEMKTQEEQQRKQVQDLKNEIEDLKQKLQRAEEEAQLLRFEAPARPGQAPRPTSLPKPRAPVSRSTLTDPGG